MLGHIKKTATRVKITVISPVQQLTIKNAAVTQGYDITVGRIVNAALILLNVRRLISLSSLW